MNKKLILIFVGIVLFALGAFVYLYNTRPLVKAIVQNVHVPKCNKYDIDLEIPELMKTSIIKFETTIAIKNTDERLIKKGCPGILQDTEQFITTSVITTSDKDIKNIDDRNFIVLKHVYITCHSAFDLDCFEGRPGDQYLIQDLSSGNKYRINSLYMGYKSKNYSRITAGYYDKNNSNLRLGDVEVKDWSCNDDRKCFVYDN